MTKDKGSPGVDSPESKAVGDVADALELSVGIDVLVAAADTDVGVSSLLLDRVQVGVAVVEVAQLITGVVLEEIIWGSGCSSKLLSLNILRTSKKRHFQVKCLKL